MSEYTYLGGNHQRCGMDVERAQLVSHDHIVDVLLSHFFQLDGRRGKCQYRYEMSHSSYVSRSRSYRLTVSDSYPTRFCTCLFIKAFAVVEV